MNNVAFFPHESVLIPVIARKSNHCKVIGKNLRRFLRVSKNTDEITRYRITDALQNIEQTLILFPRSCCTNTMNIILDICHELSLVLVCVIDSEHSSNCYGFCSSKMLPRNARILYTSQIYENALSMIPEKMVSNLRCICPTIPSLSLTYSCEVFGLLVDLFHNNICDLILSYCSFDLNFMNQSLRLWLFEFLVVSFQVPSSLSTSLSSDVIPFLEQYSWRRIGSRKHSFYGFNKLRFYWWGGIKPFVTNAYDGIFFRWIIALHGKFPFLKSTLDCLVTRYEGEESCLGFHNDYFLGNYETVILFFGGSSRNLIFRWNNMKKLTHKVCCVPEVGFVITPLANELLQHSKERGCEKDGVAYSMGFRNGADSMISAQTSGYIQNLFGWTKRIAARVVARVSRL